MTNNQPRLQTGTADFSRRGFIKLSSKKIIIMIGLSVVILIGGRLFWLTHQHFLAVRKALQSKQGSANPSPMTKTDEKSIVLVESRLNGEQVDEMVVNRRPLAVVVENHPDARPQRGLSDASIVYEAITEGGITRFLAIFGPHSAVKVGPVRSARTYFNSWAAEYDALYSHVGGNLDALQEIPQLRLKDLDQFSLGLRAYNRESKEGVATEHTMFTSTDRLYEAAKSYKKYPITSPSTASLQWKEDAPTSTRPSQQMVTIDFSTDLYQVKWAYDQPTNTYKRLLASQPHLDGNTGQQLVAKTVIIQQVGRESAVTDIGENGFKMFLVGSGPIKIIQDGQVLEGIWQKVDQKSRAKFLDQAGQEIKLNRGTMWLEIVPPGTPVTITSPESTSAQTPITQQ